MKRTKHHLLPSAEADLLRQTNYYLETANDAVSDRFYDSAERAIDHVVAWPHTGPTVDSPKASLAGLRSWPIEGFTEIRVYYRLSDRGIEIVRVLHGKRDIGKLLLEP